MSVNNKNKTTILNVLSTIFTEGLVLISAPIFTRMLGAEQYGIYALFVSWQAILGCFMGFKVESSMATAIYKFEKEYYKYKSSVLFFGVLISCLIIGVCVVLSFLGVKPRGFTNSLLVCLFLYSMAVFIIGFCQSSFVYEKKPLHNLILSLMLSLSTMILAVTFVILADNESRYLGRIYGMVIPYIFLALCLFLVVIKKERICYNRYYWKYAIGYGIPIIFHSLSRIVLSHSDRLMMDYYNIDYAKIGMYSVFFSLAATLTMLLNALNNSWCPFFFDDLKVDDWKSINEKARNYTELYTVLTCGFILLAREVGLLFAGDEYYTGVGVIPIFALGIYIMFWYHYPVNFEYYYGATKIIAIGTIVSAICNILFNMIAIPKYGMYGAAIATTISYLVLLGVHTYVTKYRMKNKMNINMRLFVPGICCVIVSAIGFYWMSEQWIFRWILAFVIGIWELFRIIRRKTIF